MLCIGFIITFLIVSFCYIMTFSFTKASPSLQRPHIIFIYADDLGWNDISFHGSPQIPTPNLDALASSGVLLNNYYGQPLCTPSRAALMTGKYPIRSGLQHHVIRANEPSALPLEMDTMPQYFKKLGYATHMVGKWHLGCKNKVYTPVFRGFDTFFGYYNGNVDYYDYTHLTDSRILHPKIFYGIDLHNGTNTVKNLRGQYATELFTEKAEDVIQNHDVSKPLFLYLSHLAVHTGNSYMPLQAPPELVHEFDYIQNDSRRVFAAMVSSMDKSVGKVFLALHQKDMLTNTILVFASDNGGETDLGKNGYSSNSPLRGKKYQVWEGGVRVPAFIWSPLLKLREGRVSMQLMHVSDWLPTLFTAIGGDPEHLGSIDGLSMWEALLSNSPSPRQEILHNIDPILNISALRKGDLKLITGNLDSGPETWYGSAEREFMELPQSMDSWVYEKGSITRDVLQELGLYLPQIPDAWRDHAAVWCDVTPENAVECHPNLSPCLFNVTEDPCEIKNIADFYPEVVQSMMKSIQAYGEQAMKPQFQDPDPMGDPMCHDFAYVSWLDAENLCKAP